MNLERYFEVRAAGLFDPLVLSAQLAEAALFDQYVVYEKNGVWLVAGDVLGDVRVDGDHVRARWRGIESCVARGERPLEQVNEALARMPIANWNAYGWMAFEFAYPKAITPTAANAESLLHVFIPKTEVRITANEVTVRSVDEAFLKRVLAVVSSDPKEEKKERLPIDVRADGRREYEGIVAAAVEAINRGELAKVILSRCVAVPFSVDFPGTYISGRRANTPSRSFLLQLGGWKALGFSPEIIVSIDAAGNVATEPLAGTRACGRGDEVDEARRAELLADPKEVFEHAISVKLAQDELLSCCDQSTVAVEDFMTVKRRGSAQHIASRVKGKLDRDRSAWDALQTLFPAVTASGIPKPAAYERIVALEPEPRGLYAGAVLCIASSGAMDAALVLRALYERSGHAWLRAGAGIVAASRPSREYEETCEKLGSVALHVIPARTVLMETRDTMRTFEVQQNDAG
jgi:salicylate synthetase